MCGEQARCWLSPDAHGGSSPRVRGTGLRGLQTICEPRFIPACAGNRSVAALSTLCQTVHPRVCGEQTLFSRYAPILSGSSPRVRGTAVSPFTACGVSRFIPACAGNSFSLGDQNAGITVHPRVCGEQSYPKTRSAVFPGSSPRVRGTVIRDRAARYHKRFIPACAGNRRYPKCTGGRTSVHPRVCGEQNSPTRVPAAYDGSSPRVRGTGITPDASRKISRFIPACAGNSTSRSPVNLCLPVHPRVCGEQVSRSLTSLNISGSSPRVRGTAASRDHWASDRRFIPACAGNSLPMPATP